ncbi:hypothetical protein ABK040_009386 [Willaertia magna]
MNNITLEEELTTDKRYYLNKIILLLKQNRHRIIFFLPIIGTFFLSLWMVFKLKGKQKNNLLNRKERSIFLTPIRDIKEVLPESTNTLYYQELLKRNSKIANDNVVKNFFTNLFDKANWVFLPSIISAEGKKKKDELNINSNSYLQYRSQTLFGREAALPRISGSSENKTLYYLEKLRQILALIYYRFPRAIAEWELWTSLAMYGLYYFFSQPIKNKQQKQSNESIYMDGVMHQIRNKTKEHKEATTNNKRIIRKRESDGGNVLKERFDELLENSSIN